MTDISTELDNDGLSLVEELRQIRDTVKSLKAREDQIRSLLLEQVGDADTALNASGAPVFEIRQQIRTGVDSKRLQALYADVWKDCQKETVVRSLRLVDPKISVEDLDD